MKMHTPDSDGGASAPEESSSHQNNSSAALAPAALNSSPGSTPSPRGEGRGEGKGTVQPAQPAWTPEETAHHFRVLAVSLVHLREAIEVELAALAPRCYDPDTFMTGCSHLAREANKLNTFLTDVQFAIRFGGPFPSPSRPSKGGPQ